MKIDRNSALIGGTVIATAVAIFKIGQYFVNKQKAKKDSLPVDVKVETRKVVDTTPSIETTNTQVG